MNLNAVGIAFSLPTTSALVLSLSAAQGIVVDVSKQVTKYAAMSSETDASAAGRSESDYVATPAKPSKAAVKGKVKQKSTTPATKVARVLSTACEETRKSDCTYCIIALLPLLKANSGQCRFWCPVAHQESSSARSARRNWRSRSQSRNAPSSQIDARAEHHHC